MNAKKNPARFNEKEPVVINLDVIAGAAADWPLHDLLSVAKIVAEAIEKRRAADRRAAEMAQDDYRRRADAFYAAQERPATKATRKARKRLKVAA